MEAGDGKATPHRQYNTKRLLARIGTIFNNGDPTYIHGLASLTKYYVWAYTTRNLQK